MPLIDLTGKRFGRLTVVSRASPIGIKRVRWAAQCDCGNETEVDGAHLRSGHTRSCGCLSVEVAIASNTIHGHSKIGRHTRTYVAWSAIKRRCFNKNCRAYRWYGARGIDMDAEWRESYSAFLRDMGEKPEGMEIDRIDNDKGYYPWNCRWTTHKENCNNRRGRNGHIHQRSE